MLQIGLEIEILPSLNTDQPCCRDEGHRLARQTKTAFDADDSMFSASQPYSIAAKCSDMALSYVFPGRWETRPTLRLRAIFHRPRDCPLCRTFSLRDKRTVCVVLQPWNGNLSRNRAPTQKNRSGAGMRASAIKPNTLMPHP